MEPYVGKQQKAPSTIVALAAAGRSIQPSQPAMPPYTPFINLSSPPATKRSPKQH